MADDEETLTEELVISKGGQYDPELLQRLTLSGLRLARLGQGLARCSNLRVLDLARNRLQTLDGIEACRRLVRLRVAGNGLRSLGGVAGLADLEHLDARANALAAVDAVAAALRPCACLTSLELRADDGAEANPCCASQTYAATLRGALPALQVLDGGPSPWRTRRRPRGARSRRRRSTPRRRRPTTGSAVGSTGTRRRRRPGRRTVRRASGRTRTGSARRWPTASKPPRRRSGRG